MVNIYIRFITFLLLIFILVVNTSSSNTDKQHDAKDGHSAEETKMSDKMIEERSEKKTKKICKKCTKSKFQESHKEVCSQCKIKGKGDCNKCVRSKFRARNNFCSSCPAVVVESKKNKSPKKQRNNAKKKNAKSPSTKVAPFVYQPIPSTGTASTKDVELGPWGTLLKEIIQANTFIDDK